MNERVTVTPELRQSQHGRSNSGDTGRIGAKLGNREAEMWAYDRLPRWMRDLLKDAPMPVCCTDVLEGFNNYPESYIRADFPRYLDHLNKEYRRIIAEACQK